MRAIGDVYRGAGVRVIYLVHGTFVGDDAFGLFDALGRFFPRADAALRDAAKQIVDALVGDAGNYTEDFAQLFEQAIHREGEPRIPVRLFRWSGQNNHIARADTAVRLIGELDDHGKSLLCCERQPHNPQSATPNPQPMPRVLLWGHSHAGNAFALMSNLLAADRDILDRFFSAASSYYRWPILGNCDVPVWPSAFDILGKDQRPIDGLALDVVTFGTPIRYGWDTDGYSQLLHFVNHRPSGDLPSHLAPFPPNIKRLITAEDGDFVQQVGIAGTNVAPSLLDLRTLLADIRLGRFLQPDLPNRGLLDRLKIGTRVPDEGTTLLVNYGPGQGGLTQHAAGHAVYTREKWLLFHAEEVAQRLYS